MSTDRYDKQVRFGAIGKSGQKKIREAEITIVGCGALGTTVAETLTRAGAGRIHLIDFDEVEWSNLQRQQLFTEEDAEKSRLKVEAAQVRLEHINKEVDIKIWPHYTDGPFLHKVASSSDVIVDASDNFDTAYVINDVAHMLGVPWVYGSLSGSTSIQMTVVPGHNACFRCLYETLTGAKETCETAGALAPAVQITAARQTVDIFQLITGSGACGGIFKLEDIWSGEHQKIRTHGMKNATCPTCGSSPAYPSFHETGGVSVLCGRGAVHIHPPAHRKISLQEGEEMMRRMSIPYKRTGLFIQGELNGHRMLLFEQGRMLIHGVSEPEEGKRLYASIFG
ncbi:ThiF family adenylyltransferase [Salimicrobium album]|uniref:Adenylyltransferase and sulfurtransferase n=1 Tax=Salimicrobium album TaxID=50717 RepID=A0A1H3F7S3_9BACI|nr:ThiF family adenylyltransferase [Salimicrobium album]SDX87021.1 adenylyltransferase and sulfurtransferase [Salimicrobium album]